MRKYKFFFFILIGLHLGFAQTPERFINHRVKKGETLIQISEIYKVSLDQILEYNPFLQNNSIRRRMNLRVPVYIQNNSLKKYFYNSK
jgi:LysM repeat protein